MTTAAINTATATALVAVHPTTPRVVAGERTAVAVPAERSQRDEDGLWIVPFALALVTSLALFVQQVATNTNVL